MDREDQDHFRTIASQSGPPPRDSKSKSATVKPSASRHDPVWALQKAKMIIGSYRRDEATDPEIFLSALVVIFDEYPAAVIDYACDPRTGVINKFQMGLPQVPQIRQFLEDAMAHVAHTQHLARLPKYRRRDPLPLPKVQNLFVPENVAGYALMVELAKHPSAIACEQTRFETRRCEDGVERLGIWVPRLWWDENHAKAPAPPQREPAKEIVDDLAGF